MGLLGQKLCSLYSNFGILASINDDSAPIFLYLFLLSLKFENILR